MKQFTCLVEELDADTREYLREVRSRRGSRTPGVFIAGSNSWPLLAFILGPVIIVAAILVGFLSTKEAWAVAMLQTAGVVLGGWMIVYAFRRWFAGGRSFAGYFTYFDPTHVYQVRGDTVTVTDVSDFHAVEVRHQYSSGSYAGSRVLFDLGGRPLAVPVSGESRADFVEEYYRSLVKLEEHDEKKWRSLPPAELGAVAKHFVAEEELPRDADDVPLEVTETPAEPARATRAAPAVIPYVIILVVGGLVYTGFQQLNDPVRDDRAFAQAEPGGAPGLRGYLIDPRNTRHRDEALAKLAKLYAPAVSRVEAGVKDPVTREGLLAILKALQEAPQPVVSIDVREKDTPKGFEGGAGVRASQLRTDLADAFATYIGKELIGFVQAPADTPAHVELVYQFVPAGADWRGPMYKVEWQLRLRADPAAPPAEPAPGLLGRGYAAVDFGAVPADVKTAVFTEVFGQAPPVIPPPPPPGGGDFDE